jgi:hypothetical protein
MNIDRFTLIRICINITCNIYKANNLSKLYTDEAIMVKSFPQLEYLRNAE